MGLAGMVISAISAVTGAIMYFAVTAQSNAVVQSHGFSLSTLGVILMIAGAVGFVISACVRGFAPLTVNADRDHESRGR